MARYRLAEEEKRLRDNERKRADYKLMKENEPEKYQEFLLDNREAFRNFYHGNRNPQTNEYPGRERVLADKQKNKKRNAKKEAEYRAKNKEFTAFAEKSRRGGRLCTKKMWDSWGKLSKAEQKKVLKQNPEAPAVKRPTGLTLRRVVRVPDRTYRTVTEGYGVTDIKETTVSRWIKKFNWDKEVEE